MTTRYTALVDGPVTEDAPAGTGSLRTLGTTNPQNLGSPAPGTATSASASDHVHQMPSAGDVGADPVGAAAAAQANAVLAANAYTDASIFAVTTSSGRAKIATTGTVANLSAVTVATLDPPYVPVAGDKILLLGSASPDGVIATSAAYGGLYDVGVVVAGVAPLTRNTNYNTIAEICGASWFVTDGTYSNDFWACTTDPTGAVLDTTPLTFVQFAGALSNNAAQPLGVAAAGTSHDVSRADHVHPFPTAGDVGAVPTSRTVSTTSPLSGGGALSGDLTLSLTLGTSAGTVAAGDDSRITGALQSASNLSDLANAATARTNLGVQDMVRLLPLSPGAQSTTSTVDVVIGGGYFDPSTYAISGRTTTLTLELVGQVSALGVTGTLTLYNLDDATSVTSSVTATSATYATAAVALPLAAKRYELRLKKSGGAAADYVLVYGVNLRVTWS